MKLRGCSTYFNKKDHLWTLYEYEQGIFKIPEDARDGMIYSGCNCGNCHMTILPNGDIYACRRVQNSKVGNAFLDRLADIWVCQMEQYRDYGKFEKCSRCELLAYCRGCPAVASGRDGNFYAADPQCWKRGVTMDVLELMKYRRSIRKYEDKQISPRRSGEDYGSRTLCAERRRRAAGNDLRPL